MASYFDGSVELNYLSGNKLTSAASGRIGALINLQLVRMTASGSEIDGLVLAELRHSQKAEPAGRNAVTKQMSGYAVLTRPARLVGG